MSPFCFWVNRKFSRIFFAMNDHWFSRIPICLSCNYLGRFSWIGRSHNTWSGLWIRLGVYIFHFSCYFLGTCFYVLDSLCVSWGYFLRLWTSDVHLFEDFQGFVQLCWCLVWLSAVVALFFVSSEILETIFTTDSRSQLTGFSFLIPSWVVLFIP